MSAVLMAGSARADDAAPGRFHYEAAAQVGVHTIGDDEAQLGESDRMFALRLLGAPGLLARVGDGQTEVGGHGVLAGMIADRGGGISAGADLMVRHLVWPGRAVEARLAVLAAVAGDDGLPPVMIMPGVGLTMAGTRSLTLRLDGELSKKDVGDGYGVGFYAGVGFDGKSAAIASGVIAGIGLAVFGILLASVGA